VAFSWSVSTFQHSKQKAGFLALLGLTVATGNIGSWFLYWDMILWCLLQLTCLAWRHNIIYVQQEYKTRGVYKTWKLLHFLWAVWQQRKHAFYYSKVKMLTIEGSTQTAVNQMLLCMITKCAARWRMEFACSQIALQYVTAVNAEGKDQSCPVVNMKVILWKKNCQKINLIIPSMHRYVTY
jgi:hypothetical protein